jgi:hypothetical protein
MNETIRASLAKRFRVSYAILLVACACLFGHKYVDLPPTLFGMESGDLVDGIGGVGDGGYCGTQDKMSQVQEASRQGGWWVPGDSGHRRRGQ